jgi:hypothetical protein|nr:MAG: hypothetical protein [Bacteriophage sp.]
METKINIVEILKDKPQGTKLYSSACGKCKLEEVDDKSFKISFYNSKFGFMNGGEGYLDKNGKLYDDGECVVFPSKEMRDWSKFAWKKGDVLVNKDGDVHIIFERFADDTYCSFVGKYYLWKENNDTEHFYENERLLTSDFQKAGKDAAQTYISTIEERLGGKLNRETLEIEKTQPEFKDGDIAFADFGNTQDVFIVSGKTNLSEGYYSFIALNLNSTKALNIGYKKNFFKENLSTIRLATEEEKQQLFDALAKEGKAWDAGKKEVVDLKPKVKLKPFDKVLCRNSKDDTWEADFFARLTRKEIDYTQSGKYLCVGDLWMYCIPYNEETAHLLGTTDDWKGGEG